MEAITIGGLVVLVGACYMMHMERKARVAARKAALLRSTEQTIQAVLLEKRYSTRQGRG